MNRCFTQQGYIPIGLLGFHVLWELDFDTMIFILYKLLSPNYNVTVMGRSSMDI